jgi:hypothetical protein
MGFSFGNAAGSGLGAALGGPLGWATLGANVLGGLFGGSAKAKQFKEELRQRNLDRQMRERELENDRYKYDRTQSQSEGNDALGVSRSLDSAPFRDRAAYLLGNRMMQMPGSFRPGDSMSPGSIGGVDRGAMADANARYTQGAGGMGGGEAVAQAFLDKLGYGQNGQSAWNRQQYWRRNNPAAGSGMTYA